MEQRIIVFGLGGKLLYEKEHNFTFYSSLNILAFCDNNSSLWGTKYDNKPVVSPNDLHRYAFDKIVVASDYFGQIVEKLVKQGIDKEKIIHWDEYVVSFRHGEVFLYGTEKVKEGKSVLLISTAMDYNGGTIAIMNAAIALRTRGYAVTLAAQSSRREIIKQMCESGINVVIAPALAYPNEKEYAWIKKYDYVIVNVFQMIGCACYISNFRKVLWWIHECGTEYSNIYTIIRSLFFEYEEKDFENIELFAVSSIARDVFQGFYPRTRVGVLPLGVIDFGTRVNKRKRNNLRDTHVFIISGAIIPRKGQLYALEAVNLLNEKGYASQYELWIVGKKESVEYAEKVVQLAGQLANVTILEAVNSEKMQEIYESIDTVICSSLEETMSMTIIEGMMNEKTCITTDNTGVAQFIEDGRNGFICKPGDPFELAEKMIWILEHEQECKSIAEIARRTFEQEFSLEKLGCRLEERLNHLA